MKRLWTEEELIERWTLLPDELSLLANKSGPTRLGFAVLLRFFAGEGRFPRSKTEVPGQVVAYVGRQVGLPAEEYLRYDWRGRTIKYHRARIREHFGFRETTDGDASEVRRWLVEEVLPQELVPERLGEAVYRRCREECVEPPSPGRIERIVASAVRTHHERFCEAVHAHLPSETILAVEALLETGNPAGAEDEESRYGRRSDLSWVKADPGRVGLKSVLEEIEKLRRVRELELPEDLFTGIHPKLVAEYRHRAATETPGELRTHRPAVTATLMAALCRSREREITDSLVDLLVQLVHRIGARAERKVEKEILEDFRRVSGKANLLFQLAEAAVERPEGTVREVLFPIAGEQTMRDLVFGDSPAVERVEDLRNYVVERKKGQDDDLDIPLRVGNTLVLAETKGHRLHYETEAVDRRFLQERWEDVRGYLEKADRTAERVAGMRDHEDLREALAGAERILPVLCRPYPEWVPTEDSRLWLRPPAEGDRGVPRILTPLELKEFLESTTDEEIAGLPGGYVVRLANP